MKIGIFPDQLKSAKVFPIYKSGNKLDPDNNRLISIFPTISKIFERHVNKHLMFYLYKYSLIHENQSGFRQGHTCSCQTAFVKLTDKWMTCTDKGEIVGALFINFQKAFDLADHKILINKLSKLKFSNQSLQWFVSYLNSRQQTIDSGSGMSKQCATIRSGVPQGSILGPTLFLLFINNLPHLLKCCFSDFFVDDATFHTSSSDIDDIDTEIKLTLAMPNHGVTETK